MLPTIQNPNLHIAVYLEGCCGKSENGRIQRMQNAKKNINTLPKLHITLKIHALFRTQWSQIGWWPGSHVALGSEVSDLCSRQRQSDS